MTVYDSIWSSSRDCEKEFLYKPVEMKKILGGGGGGLPIMKYCRPPWLTDEENFSFQIV